MHCYHTLLGFGSCEITVGNQSLLHDDPSMTLCPPYRMLYGRSAVPAPSLLAISPYFCLLLLHYQGYQYRILSTLKSMLEQVDKGKVQMADTPYTYIMGPFAEVSRVQGTHPPACSLAIREREEGGGERALVVFSTPFAVNRWIHP